MVVYYDSDDDKKEIKKLRGAIFRDKAKSVKMIKKKTKKQTIQDLNQRSKRLHEELVKQNMTDMEYYTYLYRIVISQFIYNTKHNLNNHDLNKIYYEGIPMDMIILEKQSKTNEELETSKQKALNMKPHYNDVLLYSKSKTNAICYDTYNQMEMYGIQYANFNYFVQRMINEVDFNIEPKWSHLLIERV